MNKKVAAPVPEVPQSLDEVAKYNRRMSSLLRQISMEAGALKANVERLEAEAAKRIKSKEEEIIGLAKSVHIFAHKNRAKLTDDEKKKTVEVLGTGVIQWYRTPAAVSFDKDLKVEDIVANIKTLKLMQFIRTKEEVNKEAMLENQELAKTVKGVSIADSEKFAIRPLGSDLRVEQNLSTKRWKIADKD